MLILFKATPNVFYWLEYLFFFIGLFCVGIPHGAVDYLAETGNFHSQINFKFILRYLSKAICYFVFWLFLPNVAFLLFIIYSVWHFGQCDINEWNTRYKSPLINWSWGSLLLAIILLGHIVETNLILGNLNIPIIKLTDTEGKIASLIFIFSAMLWGLWERKSVILISCSMLAVSIQLPLITSFALYFIGQHSINGWSYLKQKLRTDDLPLFMKAIPFTLGAFIIFGTLIYSMQTGLLDEFNKHWQTGFFVYISCISFPHVIAMHKFYKIETN
jgi:Brp/Blh family beta-carotene 15,15'-monooxygenase